MSSWSFLHPLIRCVRKPHAVQVSDILLTITKPSFFLQSVINKVIKLQFLKENQYKCE